MKENVSKADTTRELHPMFQDLMPTHAVKVHPLAMREHVTCPHYLDRSQVRFQHLHLSAETPFDPGRKESCMLLFLMGGCCQIKTSETGVPIKISAGELFFITAGSCFQAVGAPEGECILLHFTEFSFCENLTLQGLAQQTVLKEPQLGPFPIAAPLAAFLRNMIFYTDNQINCSHLQQIKQDECFILMRICYTKEILAQVFAPLLCDKNLLLKMKIQRFAAQTHTIAELAARCEMTEITMKRKIPVLFGISAHQWMLRQRNRQILFDLRNGHTPKEICFTYNYSSLSNFTAYCKRQFGFTPSQIIRLPQKEYTELQQKYTNDPL